jgi:hemerythrin-like domain-containing protein
MPLQIGWKTDHGFGEPLGLLSDCHRRIEHFLGALIAISQHAPDGPLTPALRAELESALTYFASAAPKHTADEEQSLFPRLRAVDDTAAAHALETIARLEQDHDDADRDHRTVDALGRRWLTRGHLEPAEADELRECLTRLDALYRKHIGIEDRELFPAAARLLSDEQLQEVGREMAARRKPAAKP